MRDISERMRKRPGVGPRHSKHHMKGDACSFSTMDVSEARGVRDDDVCDKRLPSDWVAVNAGPPKALKHTCNHSPISLNVSLEQARHAWQKTWVLDHISHQIRRIASHGKEVDARCSRPVGK